MRAQDVIIGKWYRLRSNTTYSYIKPIKKYCPCTFKKEITKTIFKCEHVVQKDCTTGFIKYFYPCDFIKEEN